MVYAASCIDERELAPFEAHHAASVRRPKVARPMRRVIGINIKIILRTPHTHIREPPFAPAHPPRAQRVCGERC